MKHIQNESRTLTLKENNSNKGQIIKTMRRRAKKYGKLYKWRNTIKKVVKTEKTHEHSQRRGKTRKYKRSVKIQGKQ